MKYNILWFDDNGDYIETHEPTLREYLKQFGFELVVTPKIDDGNLEEVLKACQADLILMDYRLSNVDDDEDDTELTGDCVIKRIRECKLIVETVLYSRDPLFPTNVKEKLDGVFLATHTELPEKAKKIIYLTIKKQQEIANIRGVFITEAIDIASEMEELIIKILKIQPPVDLDLFKLGIMHSEFFSDYEKFKLILDFLTYKEKILKEIVSSTKYTGPDRQKAAETVKLLSSKIYKFKEMERAVIKKRNILAHSKPSPDNLGLIYKDKLIPLGEKECKEIREDFAKQLDNIKEIAKIIDLILAVDYPK